MLSAIVGSVFAARGPANEQVASFLASSAAIAGTENYLESIVARLSFWPFLVLFQGVWTLVIPIALLLAFWAARQRILEEPGAHLPLLRRVAVVGLAVGWGAGLVHALEHLDVLVVPDQVFWVFSVTQLVTGLFGGLGYVALFGLIAHRIAVRRATGSTAGGGGDGRREAVALLLSGPVGALRSHPVGVGPGAGRGAGQRRGRPVRRRRLAASPWCSRTRRNGPGSAVRPRCCSGGWSTAGAPNPNDRQPVAVRTAQKPQ